MLHISTMELSEIPVEPGVSGAPEGPSVSLEGCLSATFNPFLTGTELKVDQRSKQWNWNVFT